MKGIDKRKFYIKSIIYILTITAGWAFFNLIRIGAEKILFNFGITSEIIQMLAIIGFVFLMFILLGFGFRISFKKVMGS